METMIIDSLNFDESKLSTESKVELHFNKDLSNEDLMEVVLKLLSFSNSDQFVFRLKELPKEKVIYVLDKLFSDETLSNPSILLNINLLISCYNTLNDAMFNSEDIFFDDIEQLLDAKLALGDKIKDTQTKLIFWYLSSLKSMHKVEYTYLDKIHKIPKLYRLLLLNSNFLSLSQIMTKINNIETKDLVLVEDAYDVIHKFINVSMIMNKVFEDEG